MEKTKKDRQDRVVLELVEKIRKEIGVERTLLEFKREKERFIRRGRPIFPVKIPPYAGLNDKIILLQEESGPFGCKEIYFCPQKKYSITSWRGKVVFYPEGDYNAILAVMVRRPQDDKRGELLS